MGYNSSMTNNNTNTENEMFTVTAIKKDGSFGIVAVPATPLSLMEVKSNLAARGWKVVTVRKTITAKTTAKMVTGNGRWGCE
jgi:hypothetical protein